MNQYEISPLQKDYTTIETALVSTPSPSKHDIDQSLRRYTFKTEHKDCLKEGDWFVVETARERYIVQIVAVHSEPQIDLNAPYRDTWVGQKIHLSHYEQRHKEEKELSAFLRNVHTINAKFALGQAIVATASHDPKLLQRWHQLSDNTKRIHLPDIDKHDLQ